MLGVGKGDCGRSEGTGRRSAGESETASGQVSITSLSTQSEFKQVSYTVGDDVKS